MFKRRNRLSRTALEAILKSGKRLSSAHFSVVISTNVSGYAVVIPKKIARLSVTRHRIKRRVLEALRTASLQSGVVVFPRAETKDMRYDEMCSELNKLLS